MSQIGNYRLYRRFFTISSQSDVVKYCLNIIVTMILKAPQSGALRISAYRDFQSYPIPIPIPSQWMKVDERGWKWMKMDENG